MRAHLREKLAEEKPVDENSFKRQLGEMTWKDVRDGPERLEVEDWEKRDLIEAQRMARRLSREFGSHLHQKAHIFARALLILDTKLPIKLVQSEAWKHGVITAKSEVDPTRRTTASVSLVGNLAVPIS
jgi:hypothetical protein